MNRLVESKYRRYLPFFVLAILAVVVYSTLWWLNNRSPLLSSRDSLEVIINERRLDRYRFDFLRSYEFEKSSIEKIRITETTGNHTTWMAHLPTHSGTVSAQLKIPDGTGPFPVIVMLRGYAEREGYFTGLGTRNAARVFADSGYVTIAVDFLGYGESAPESNDVLETRFERPATVLHLLASLESLEEVDASRVGIWGHSNGGQIALSVLQMTQRSIPTTLWAPVSIGFPDSITHFFPTFSDGGSYLENELNRFSERYVFEDFSISDHWSSIRAPIRIHQGTADTAVPAEWSQELYRVLQEHSVDVEYFEYPGADHNLSGTAWSTAIQRDLSFFQRNL